MDDWWDLIDHEAALKEQFPSFKAVRAERAGGRLARALDAEHARRAARFRYRSKARHLVDGLVADLGWRDV